MLTPEFLENAPKTAVELYAQVEANIIAFMAARINGYNMYIPAVEHQMKKLEEMGLVREEIINRLSALTGKSEVELKQIMKESGNVSLKSDDEVYRRAGLDPPLLRASPALQAILAAGYQKTAKTLRNLTGTTANIATKQFEDALDRAWLQVSTGAFTLQEATRFAVKDLAKHGIATITYPSGHTDYLDVAVRRAVLTGINQTCGQLQETRADDMDCDLVEVTAHAGARPSHAVWQGKIYSLSGKHPKYPSLREATGYGTGPGLKGWNCRHDFFPFFEGTSEPSYTPKMLAEYNAKNYTYNGQQMTEYEATQKQRAIERNIRKWKREEKAMQAVGLPTEEARAKVTHWNKVQKDFLEQTGLRRQYDREKIYGAIERLQNRDIIKSGAISGARNPYGEAANAHAERYYGLVRSMKTDVKKIAKTTGYPQSVIQEIKNFIFMDKHDLGEVEPEYFKPDYMMAESWRRLMNGKPEPHDITLIRHEIMENSLIKEGYTQEEAHRLTSAKYNYGKEAVEFYDKIKKYKKE